ncbi:MAG: hypothetical protein ACK4SL_00870 [Candidatus Paceibacteria bacterium]
MRLLATVLFASSIVSVSAETLIAPLGGKFVSSGGYYVSSMKGERFFEEHYVEESDQTYFWYLIYRYEDGVMRLLKVTRRVKGSEVGEVLFVVPGYEAL